MAKQVRCIGILTAGGDCPGLNAAIRGVGKAAIARYGVQVVGIHDGFRGLVEGRTVVFQADDFSGILTEGGTILGTSRDRLDKLRVGEQEIDMTAAAVETYHHLHLDALVCLGGNGTQTCAHHLMTAGGLNVVTLPKTIDNDVWGTDVTFGFNTAVGIATEALDRIHSTAESHNRVMLVELMGHNAGWLALQSGVASGADVVLLPEIPYSMDAIVEAILDRTRRGKRSSILAVAEGARSVEERDAEAAASAGDVAVPVHAAPEDAPSLSQRLAREIEARTDIETRTIVLGHLQRGGTPSPFDRQLATRLGTAAARMIVEGLSGVMIAARGEAAVPVPLEEVSGKTRTVPLDHPLVESARMVGTSFGDA